MTFRETLANYVAVEKNSHSGSDWVYEAAMKLPQDERRQVSVAQADGIVRADYAARLWAIGIEDAASYLNDLIVTHDNGGTLSSPKKIKAAALELLRLLGES